MLSTKLGLSTSLKETLKCIQCLVKVAHFGEGIQ
jgi:hypothetical protein